MAKQKYKIENKETTKDLIRLGKTYVISAFIISSVTFALWFLNFDFLKNISIEKSAIISPISAFSFIVLSLSIWLIRNEKANSKLRYSSNILCILAGIIGLARVLIFSLDLPSSLDALILGDALSQKQNIQYNTNLNSMSPIAGVIILLTSISIFLINYTKKDFSKFAQFLNYTSVLMGLLAIYTYAYDIENIYTYVEFIPISIFSSISTVFVSTGMLFLRPHRGSMATVVGQNSTKIVLLRFLAFFVPLAIGWFKIHGTKMGLYSKEFGAAITATATFAIAMALLGWKSFIQAKLKKVRYKKEENIRKSRELIKHILDISPLTISIIDLKTKEFEYVNEANRKRFRINGADLKNIKYSSMVEKLVVDEDKRKVADRFNKLKALKKNDFSEMSYRLKDKNGKINWVMSNASVYAYKNNQPKKIILNTLNITKQKKLEEELKEKNRKIQKENEELDKINQRLQEINENLEEEVDKAIYGLKESERACKDFFENSFEGILHYGFEGIESIDTKLDIDEQLELITKHVIITEANKEVYNLHKYKDKKQLIGTPVVKFLKMPKEDKLKIIKSFIENDYGLEKASTIHTASDGSSINLYTTITGIIDEGKLIGAWATQVPRE